MIIIIATIGQAVAGHGPAVSLIGVLVFWRFIMGLGIGGQLIFLSSLSEELIPDHAKVTTRCPPP